MKLLRGLRWEADLLALHLTAGLIGFALKLHYSRAGAEDLRWILDPACGVASFAFGIPFEWERGAGWVSREDLLIVGPPCAGVNFLIAAFLILFAPLVSRFPSAAARLLYLGLALAVAFGLTVAANGARIGTAVSFAHLPIHGPVLTPERVHRAGGAVLYCVTLLAGFVVMERLTARLRGNASAGGRLSPLLPLCCYPCLVLGVPLLNGASGSGAGRFVEHAAILLAVCALLALPVVLLEAARRHPRSREP